MKGEGFPRGTGLRPVIRTAGTAVPRPLHPLRAVSSLPAVRRGRKANGWNPRESARSEIMGNSVRLTRREFVQGSGAAIPGAGAIAASLPASADEPKKPADRPGPDEVLRKLLAGNTRYTRGE